jgi:hypothetical protein
LEPGLAAFLATASGVLKAAAEAKRRVRGATNFMVAEFDVTSIYLRE